MPIVRSKSFSFFHVIKNRFVYVAIHLENKPGRTKNGMRMEKRIEWKRGGNESGVFRVLEKKRNNDNNERNDWLFRALDTLSN